MYSLFGEIISRNYFDEKLYTENENTKNLYKLKKVLNYIRKSYSKQITLKDMAQIAGVSPKYFCSFFKNMTAKTPVEYLNSYRIEKAAANLLASDSSVTDIAYSCGFNDLSYFIKVFRDLKGISPKQFKKNRLKIIVEKVRIFLGFFYSLKGYVTILFCIPFLSYNITYPYTFLNQNKSNNSF